MTAAPVPALRIRLARNADGTSVLSCTRADGTTTWQKSHGRSGAFFPAHDLTHYAVETTLGARGAFYGLLAEGWDIADFASGVALPDEALLVEAIVGTLDLQRATAPGTDAAAFRAQLEALGTTDPRTAQLLAVLDVATLDRLLTSRDALLARWAAVPPGGALELSFAIA